MFILKMIFINNYTASSGDFIHLNYDTHNEDTNLGTDARYITVLNSSFYNPSYKKGLSFTATCEGIQKTFYDKRIMEAVIKRNNTVMYYTNPRYEDCVYIGPEGDR